MHFYCPALLKLACLFIGVNGHSYQRLLQWKFLDYQWSSQSTREESLAAKAYVPENNAITGIKVRGCKIFLTVPRWRHGVPSTLNVVEIELDERKGRFPVNAPRLSPYPSWEMQQVGDCSAFQYVQSMEIDWWGRMWVVDLGRVSTYEDGQTNNKCKPKLVLIDLEEDELLHLYEFPEAVVSSRTNFLNDLVVDCVGGRHECKIDKEEEKNNCFAYITDASDAKLVVYNLKENRSWFLKHKSMLADPNATNMTILGKRYKFNASIDGIALSPYSSGHHTLFYTPLSSYSLYSVPTCVLRESENGVTLRDDFVTIHSQHRPSQSDGLAMDANGVLYYGQLQTNSIVYVVGSNGISTPMNFSSSYYNTPLYSEERLLIQNDVDFQWQDAFAFDDQGYLYVVTNRLHCFHTNTCNWADINFRVVRILVGSPSYQHWPWVLTSL